MATFFNQATLNFNGSITGSNVTEGQLLERVGLTKTAISQTYGRGDEVVYALTLTNSGDSAVTNLTISDDLGAYTPVGGTAAVTPLTYLAGSASFFINGVETAAPAVTAGPPLQFTGINLPAGANATLYYVATANGVAPLEAGSVITNTVTATGGGIPTPLTDTATVNVREEADLSIAKAICPQTVTDGGELTYTFIIQNAGNLAVVATDTLTVTDTFDPILEGITVTLNGETLTEGVGYTYDQTTGLFTTLPGQITVPAATYTQDPVSGEITLNPGVALLTVTGTV